MPARPDAVSQIRNTSTGVIARENRSCQGARAAKGLSSVADPGLAVWLGVAPPDRVLAPQRGDASGLPLRRGPRPLGWSDAFMPRS